MTARRHHHTSAWLAITVCFSGCLSPHENFYTLGTASDAALAQNRPVTIVVGPVVLPQLVDRPQLVIRDGDYKVVVLEQERWATPLKESLPRLLADELNQRLSDRRFVPLYSRAIAASHGQLVIDINRFDATRGAGARLVAHWVYHPSEPNSTPVEGDTDVQSKVTASGYEGLVQALQRVSLALADDMAAHLTSTAK